MAGTAARKRIRTMLVIASCLWMLAASSATAQSSGEYQRLGHDILKQLIETNTTDSVGNVTAAAEAMATRLREAGFPEKDLQVAGARDNTQNLVVRYRG